MDVLVVGGSEQDEAKLAGAFAGAESSFVIRRLRFPATARCRALVFEAADRPELAALGLALARSEAHFDEVPLLLAVSAQVLARVDPMNGFDELLLHPYTEEELGLRLSALEFRRNGTAGRERMGGIVFDHRKREVEVNGRAVSLTTKEFALFSYLWTQRGRVLTRRTLLNRIWGEGAEVGPRTVDIHVRRLRVKLGGSVPLETLRGTGYKLRVHSAELPDRAVAER